MVATIPTTQGVNFVVGGGVATEVQGFLSRLASNPLWQAHLTSLANAGTTTVIVTDNLDDLQTNAGGFNIRSSLETVVYHDTTTPAGEVGGATTEIIGSGYAWILMNSSDGVWQNGALRDRFTIFTREGMHLGQNPINHGPTWTGNTQAVLTASGVPAADPNKALSPTGADGTVFYSGANPLLTGNPQTAGIPNPGATIPLPSILSVAKDDGSQTVTDAAGNITLQDIRLANGGFQFIYNDIANVQPWTSKVSIANALGVISSTNFTVGAADTGTITGTAGVIDTINSSKSTTLGANVENLTLQGAAAINGTGNALDNSMVGNTAANTLSSDGGNDTLYGLDGNDILIGGAGIGSLIGGAGADTLQGGLGDDVYVADALDTVIELAGQGNDTVYADFNYTLGVNLENLILTGSTATSGTGNASNNILQSNLAATTLTGGAGISPLPVAHFRANGERVRVRGGNRQQCKRPPLTPALSPLSAEMGRGGRTPTSKT